MRAWSTPVMAVRISSQARTDSQERALTYSREPKAVPSAVVPASWLKTVTVSRTYAQLFTLPCAAQPRAAPATHQKPTAE